MIIILLNTGGVVDVVMVAHCVKLYGPLSLLVNDLLVLLVRLLLMLLQWRGSILNLRGM